MRPPGGAVVVPRVALIATHRPSFTNYATTRALSGRVLCSTSTSASEATAIARFQQATVPLPIRPRRFLFILENLLTIGFGQIS